MMVQLRTVSIFISFTAICFCSFLASPQVGQAAGCRRHADVIQEESAAHWVDGVEGKLQTLQVEIVSITRHESSFTGKNNWPEYLPAYRAELVRRYDMFISEGNRLLETLRVPPTKVPSDDMKKLRGLLQTLERQAHTLSVHPLATTENSAPPLPSGCDFKMACDIPDCAACCSRTGDEHVSLIITSKNCGVCRLLRMVCALNDTFEKVGTATGSR